jgi:hypothetical protein
MLYIRMPRTSDNAGHHFLFLAWCFRSNFLVERIAKSGTSLLCFGYWRNFKTLFSVNIPNVCQIKASYREQKKAAIFANHTTDSAWETLAQGRKVARICALFKEYFAERTWQSIMDRLKGPCCLSRDDHDRKIGPRYKEEISINISL